jgi:hypothetical protein
MATTGCEISHKDTEHTDKCSNNRRKTTLKQHDETTNTFSKYCKDNTKKKFDIKYAYIIQSPYNNQ